MSHAPYTVGERAPPTLHLVRFFGCMEHTLHTNNRTLNGALRLMEAMSLPRRENPTYPVPAYIYIYCRGARVFGLNVTATHRYACPFLPSPPCDRREYVCAGGADIISHTAVYSTICMPGVGWLSERLLSVPDERPSGGGEDKNIV